MAPVFPLDFSRTAPLGPRRIAPSTIGKTAAAEHQLADLLRERGRRRIWDLDSTFHCAIIGTCLSTAELRQLLIRLELPGADTASDHDLHGQGVLLARNRDTPPSC